jgi:hypothetical protein
VKLIVLISAFSFCFCVGPVPSSNQAKDSSRDVEMEHYRKELHRAHTVEIFLAGGSSIIGMESYQVDSAIGIPNQINKTINTDGVYEQRVYSIMAQPYLTGANYKSVYLYFNNGKLTSFQD